VKGTTYLVVEHPDAYSDLSEVQLWKAALHTAGVLGRLLAAATPFLVQERLQHRCREWLCEQSDDPHCSPQFYRGCGIGALDLLTPSDNPADPGPEIWIDIPTKRVKHWLKMVNVWLEKIGAEQRAMEAAQRTNGRLPPMHGTKPAGSTPAPAYYHPEEAEPDEAEQRETNARGLALVTAALQQQQQRVEPDWDNLPIPIPTLRPDRRVAYRLPRVAKGG
jgi:hypothetical protein